MRNWQWGAAAGPDRERTSGAERVLAAPPRPLLDRSECFVLIHSLSLCQRCFSFRKCSVEMRASAIFTCMPVPCPRPLPSLSPFCLPACVVTHLQYRVVVYLRWAVGRSLRALVFSFLLPFCRHMACPLPATSPCHSSLCVRAICIILAIIIQLNTFCLHTQTGSSSFPDSESLIWCCFQAPGPASLPQAYTCGLRPLCLIPRAEAALSLIIMRAELSPPPLSLSPFAKIEFLESLNLMCTMNTCISRVLVVKYGDH